MRVREITTLGGAYQKKKVHFCLILIQSFNQQSYKILISDIINKTIAL